MMRSANRWVSWGRACRGDVDAVGVVDVLLDGVGGSVQRGQTPPWGDAHRVALVPRQAGQTWSGSGPRGTTDRAGQARLSLAELDAAIGMSLIEVYHHRGHSETGDPPRERWEAGGFLPHMPSR